MASDLATVHLILGLLDRLSFKTLEHTVQQFKDHKEKFCESLFELKSLKPSAGDRSNAFTHSSSHGVQARCTPLKPPTGADCVSVSTQARCTPLKPPVNSTFVQEAIENHGCKPYTLRPRASRKVSTSGVPQRITRSRAKQPATSIAAVCNSSTRTEFMVLEDDFVEVGAKANRNSGRIQASFQGECPTEAAVSDPNQSLEQLVPSSQDVIATTTSQNLQEIYKRELLTPSSMKSFENPGKETCCSQDVIAAQKQPEICKRELTPSSLKSSKHPGKETSSSGDPVLGFNTTTQLDLLSPHLVQQIPLLKKGNSVTPRQNTGNCKREHVHVHHEEGTSGRSCSRNHSIGTGAAVFAKSPSTCIHSPTLVEQSFKQIIDAVPCKAKQEKHFPIDAEDGPCPNKNDALILQPSPINLKHSPPSTCHEFNGTGIRQSNSRKRKLSVCACCIVANDDLHCRKRISVNSIEVEAFSFDIDDTSKSIFKHYSVNGVAELTCNHSMPNLKMNEEFASVPTLPCGSMSSAGKEPDAADNVLVVDPDVDTHSLHTEAGDTHDMEEKTLFSVETKGGLSTQLGSTFESEDLQVVSGCDFIVPTSPCESMSSAGKEPDAASVPTLPCGSMSSAGKEPDAAGNVLVVGPDVDTHSLHTEAGDTPHDIEEKTVFSVETKGGFSTQLGDTFESEDLQVVSGCDFAPTVPTSPCWSMSSAGKEPDAVSVPTSPCGSMSSAGKEPDAANNVVVVGPDVDTHSLHTEAGDTPHHMEEKTLFSVETKGGLSTQLGGTFESADLQVDSGCDFAFKESIKTPGDNQSDQFHRENKTTQEWKLTLKGDEDILRFNQLLAQGTVNTQLGDTFESADLQVVSGCDFAHKESIKISGEDQSDQLLHRENKTIQEWKLTPKGDEDILRFNQLLAQGTVNSNRRKRARSPANFSEESYKHLKKMKLSVIENNEQISDEKLSHAFLPERPSFGKSISPLCGFPPIFSPIRRFQDNFGIDDFCGELPSSDGFDSLQRQVTGNDKLCKSYSRRREYLDTPHIRSARGLVDMTSAKFKKSEWHLDTHLEEDGKENQTTQRWLKDKCYRSTGLLSEKQATADTRKVLGNSNQSLGGPVERTHKRYNLAVETRSFLDLVQQKQLPLPYPNGKREVRVKALEAAELARRQEERRENDRKMRRLECNEAKSIESEGFKDKMMSSCASTIAVKGITDKVKRVAESKMKMDQEKAKKQEVEQKKKEEDRKKKEAEFADKKRKREDADRKDREEKRKRVEEVQRLKKELEERQRSELEEKENKRKMLEERERERKALEEEAKKHRRLEKEKEAERRRKQEQHLKASRLLEKQAERKRKEAMLHVRGYEDDPIAQLASGNKLSLLSTESFAVSTSTDWEAQSKSTIRTRSQTSEDIWRLRLPCLGASVHCQTNNEKLSTSSYVGNGTSFSTKAVVNEAGFNFEEFKGLKLQYSTPSNLRLGAYAPAQQTHLESNIQSYEISPYKSSSDDEDNDDQPKKPIPLWARKENLLPQILWQQCMDPDDIFSTEKTCSLAEIFGTAGSRRCKDFTQRSTSGDWLDDHATRKEELDYKKAMGYIQG